MIYYYAIATIDRLQRVVPRGVLRVGGALPGEATLRNDGGIRCHALVDGQVVGNDTIATIHSAQRIIPHTAFEEGFSSQRD